MEPFSDLDDQLSDFHGGLRANPPKRGTVRPFVVLLGVPRQLPVKFGYARTDIVWNNVRIRKAVTCNCGTVDAFLNSFAPGREHLNGFSVFSGDVIEF